MARFFVEASQVRAGRARLVGGAADHLARSLRSRPGDRLVVVDSSGREHGLCLDSVSPEQVSGRVLWTREATGEPELAVHLLQAIPKDGMDQVVEAAAALGTSSIRPCLTERTVVRLDPSRRQRRLEHWRRIAHESAQRSERATAPAVEPIASLDEACTRLPNGARILALVVDEAAQALSQLDLETGRPLVLCVGPEGGFGPADLARLEVAGAGQVHLGPRVLLSRLAGAAALVVAMTRAGELDRPAPAAPWGSPA